MPAGYFSDLVPVHTIDYDLQMTVNQSINQSINQSMLP